MSESSNSFTIQQVVDHLMKNENFHLTIEECHLLLRVINYKLIKHESNNILINYIEYRFTITNDDSRCSISN